MTPTPNRRSTTALILSLAGLALAASCGSGAKSFAFSFAEQRAELPNGLRLVVLPDASTDLVEVDVRYSVGSSSDPEGKGGLAHLVEHLMFLQRPDGPTSPPLMRYINQVATFANAYTNWDSTHYMMMGRKENLSSMLQLEAMRLFYGCQGIPEAEFEREREVVRNEIRQRTGTADGQIPQLVLSAVYPDGHAYRRMIGGNDAQLADITLADACAFVAKYYSAANATVIVAGGVTREEVMPLAGKWFGKLPRKQPASVAAVARLELSRKRVSHEVAVERPWIYAAWALPARNTRDGEVANFAIGALAGQVAFFTSQWDFATRVVPQVFGGQLAPIFVLGVELRSEDRRDEAMKFIVKAAEGATRGLFADTFDKGHKARARASFVRDLESLQARTNLLGELAQFETRTAWTSAEQLWERRLNSSDDLDGGHIKRVLDRTLAPERAIIIDIVASAGGIRGDRRAGGGFQSQSHESGREQTEVDPAEAKRPLPVPKRPDQLSQAKRFTLGNGMSVVLLSSSAMPVVTAVLTFGAGAAHEPNDRVGLAGVAGRFLQPPINSRALFSDFGIDTRSGAGDDSTTFVASGMEPYLEPLIKGLERYIAAGQYSQESLEQWQRLQKMELGSQRYRERSALTTQLYAAVYGADHPYTVGGPPTMTSVGRLDRDAATRFKNAHFTARNATLVLTGKFDAAAAEKHIRDHFGDWGKGREPSSVSLAPGKRSGSAHVGVVAATGPQLSVRIAYPGPAGIDDRHAARLVLEELLDLRMGAIRNQLGSTYGVYARRPNRIGPSMYELGGRVDAARAGESLAAMRASLDELRGGYDGFDADFARARRKVVQGLLSRSGVSLDMAFRLTTIARYRLSPDFYDRLLGRAASVTPAEVRALIATELASANEVVVCMADRATLEKAFATAGFDSVELIEPK